MGIIGWLTWVSVLIRAGVLYSYGCTGLQIVTFYIMIGPHTLSFFSDIYIHIICIYMYHLSLDMAHPKLFAIGALLLQVFLALTKWIKFYICIYNAILGINMTRIEYIPKPYILQHCTCFNLVIIQELRVIRMYHCIEWHYFLIQHECNTRRGIYFQFNL